MKSKLLFIVLIALLLLTACGGVNGDDNRVRSDNNRIYSVITIEGMTCIEYKGTERYALTCDWDMWEGRAVTDGK